MTQHARDCGVYIGPCDCGAAPHWPLPGVFWWKLVGSFAVLVAGCFLFGFAAMWWWLS